MNYSHAPLNDVDTFRKIIVRRLSLWEHNSVHLHKPRRYSLQTHLGYKLAQHVAVQNNIRVNQAQKKIMHQQTR